jgi:hypothetical protein
LIKIIKELNIEVTKPNVFQAIVAKQYDMNTRFIKATFVDCGERIDIPNSPTLSVVINAERKDGQSKGFDGEINEDGTVTVPLHSWMLELEGMVICDISVIDTATDNEKKLTTTSFTLIVEKAAYGGDDVTSDPQYDVLIELIKQVEGLGADQTYTPESTNAQSGIAVAEAVSGKADVENWEHIDTITIGEAVENITVDKEPNGTPYNFKKLFIMASVPKQPANANLRFMVNQSYICGIANSINASWDAKSTVEVSYYEGTGITKVVATQNTNAFSNATNATIGFQEIKSPYTMLKIYASANTIPVGTVFKIMGVRA